MRTYRSRRARTHVLRIGAFVCTAFLLSSCSGNSFLGRKFDDFTAHYNKFYNANRTFRQQERKLEAGDEKIDTYRFLPTYELPKQQGRSTELEKVITKCADLLRNHPRSKWVDDALMLIGKSYFYQTNFVGAEQKFNEIINLNGELKDEAEFWLARTLVAGQSSNAAEEIIGAALAEDDLDEEWRSRFLLLRGDLRTEVGLWESAIADVEEGLKNVDDGETAARAYFLLGQLREFHGDYEQAVDAYHRSQSKKPLYELSYAAMVGEIRVLGLYVDPERALDQLADAMRENKHFQNRFHLQYLRARILAAAGDPIAGRDSFFEQLYPSDPTRKTNLRGEVHYRLAELYRDYLGDFYAAGAHFDTASSILRSPPVQNEQFAPDAIIDARELAATFKDYRETLDQVTRMDSLLYLGSLDQASFDSAVAAVRVQLAEEAARIQAELERRKTESRFRQAATDSESRTPGGRALATASPNQGAFGFLNHKNLQRVQEAFLNFKEVWGDRPLVSGWRREEAVALAQRQAIAEKTEDGVDVEETNPSRQVRFLPPVNVSEVPRDSTSKAKMRAERAEARYRLANVLFLSIGLPDSAAKWYRRVIDEDAKDPVAHRALYAMAEVHEALGDDAAATRTLEGVIERYHESEFADRARARLGLDVESVAAADTLEIATNRYEAVYAIWKRGAYEEAIDGMIRIAADFPNREIAAKALLATARIFLEKAHRDGDDFYGVIPIGDSVFAAEEISAAIAAAAPPPPDSMGAAIDSTIADSTVDVTAMEAISSDTLIAVADEVDTEVDKVDTVDVPIPTAPQAQNERDAEPVSKGRIQDREDEELIVKTDKELVIRDDLAARRDVVEPERAIPDEQGDTVPVNRRMATDSTLADVSADSAGMEMIEDLSSAIDTVETMATPHPDDAGVPSDTSNGLATVETETEAKPSPPKIPEIDWIEPDYYVKDLIPMPMTLRSLYASVGKHFGTTPYGDRASELQEGLEAVRTALAVAELEAEQGGDGAPDSTLAQPPATTPRPERRGDP